MYIILVLAFAFIVSGCTQDLGVAPDINTNTNDSVHSHIGVVGRGLMTNGDTISVPPYSVVSFYDASTGPQSPVRFKFYDNGDTSSQRGVDHPYNYPAGKYRVVKYTFGPINTDSSWIYIKLVSTTVGGGTLGEHYVLWSGSIYNPNNGKMRYFSGYNADRCTLKSFPWYVFDDGTNYNAVDLSNDSLRMFSGHQYWETTKELWDSTVKIYYGGYGGHGIPLGNYQYASSYDSSRYWNSVLQALLVRHIGGQIYPQGSGPAIVPPGIAGDQLPQNKYVSRWEVTSNNTIRHYLYMPTVPGTTGYNPWVKVWRNNAWYTPTGADIVSKGYVGSSGWYYIEYTNSFLSSLQGNLKTKFGTDLTLESSYYGSKFKVVGPASMGTYLDQYFIGFRPTEKIELIQ